MSLHAHDNVKKKGAVPNARNLTLQTFDAITTSPKSVQTILQCLSPSPIPKAEFCTLTLNKDGVTLATGGIRKGWQGTAPKQVFFRGA